MWEGFKIRFLITGGVSRKSFMRIMYTLRIRGSNEHCLEEPFRSYKISSFKGAKSAPLAKEPIRAPYPKEPNSVIPKGAHSSLL